MAVDGAIGERTFPALDPEPPPRPWWKRLAVAAAVVAVTAGAVLGGVAASHSSGGAAAPPGLPSSAAGGSVLSESVGGALTVSAPTGRHASSPRQLLSVTVRGPVAASPDRRWLMLPDGRLVSTQGARPTVVPTRFSPAPAQEPGYPAFTGGDGHVVVLTEGRYGGQDPTAELAVVDLATGAFTDLGEGRSAAGDPKRPGAFVVVASGSPAVGDIRNPAIPDASVELIDAGRKPVVLATAASLAGDVGLDPTTPVALDAVPDPTGSVVAVEVQDLTRRPGSGDGLVVMDRTGSVSASEPDLSLAASTFPAWSPDGTTIAYADQSAAGPAIEIWTVGSVVDRALLPAGVPAGQCLWSPTGTAILCAGPSGPADRARWTWSLTTRTGGPVSSAPGPGLPLDWYGP